MNDDRGSSQSKSESLSQGVKYDEDKLKYHLVDPFALAWLVATLSYGAVKYEEENWREVKNANSRYYAALLRHLELWRAGEVFDEESGLPHLACVMFCAMCLTALNAPRSFKSIHQITSEAVRRERVLREKRQG